MISLSYAGPFLDSGTIIDNCYSLLVFFSVLFKKIPNKEGSHLKRSQLSRYDLYSITEYCEESMLLPSRPFLSLCLQCSTVLFTLLYSVVGSIPPNFKFLPSLLFVLWQNSAFEHERCHESLFRLSSGFGVPAH